MTSPHNKHPSPTAIHFFKVIVRTSLAHGILKLPKMFSRKYGDGISNPVILKSPDSNEWKIYWTKHDGEIWFQKGWKEFALYYSLDHGHLLFFEYEGSSHFDVHIFDNSALEIDYPSYDTHDGKDNLVAISDDSVEILDGNFSCQGTRLKPTVTFPQPCQKMKNSINTNIKRSHNGIGLHHHVQTKSSRSSRSQEEKFMKQKLDEDEGKGTFDIECSKVEKLTSNALKKAITFRSEHPSFLLVTEPSFINGDYLEIPPHFIEKYLKKTNSIVILEVLDGRTWPVIYSAPRLTEGWLKFASENNLNVGNVCVFELIHNIQGLAFKVFIFRGAEEPTCPISQGGSSSKKSARLESQLKSNTLITREEANKFTSENPFFMVTLTKDMKNNRTYCPHVPMNFVRKYFVNMKRNVLMMQFRKKIWPVNFIYKSGLAKLSAGWSSFARENKLQAGDICIFELVNREDATLDVHVFKHHSQVMR